MAKRKRVEHQTAYANPKFFQEFVKNDHKGSVRAAVKALGGQPSAAWFYQVMDDESPDSPRRVQQSVLLHIAKETGKSLKLMTVRPREFELSADPEHYGGLWQSVYVDYDRRNDRADLSPLWWREEIVLTPKSKKKGYSLGVYQAKVLNEHKVKFEGEATLFNTFHLSISAVQQGAQSGREPEAIVLSFTEKGCVNGTEVLIGTWSGTDMFNVNARVFRNLLCRRKLEIEEIWEVTARTLLPELGQSAKLGS